MEGRLCTPPHQSQTLLCEGFRRTSEEAGKGSQGNSVMQTPAYQTACSGWGQIQPLVQDIVSALAELVDHIRCDPTIPLGVLPALQVRL